MEKKDVRAMIEGIVRNLNLRGLPREQIYLAFSTTYLENAQFADPNLYNILQEVLEMILTGDPKIMYFDVMPGDTPYITREIELVKEDMHQRFNK